MLCSSAEPTLEPGLYYASQICHFISHQKLEKAERHSFTAVCKLTQVLKTSSQYHARERKSLYTLHCYCSKVKERSSARDPDNSLAILKAQTTWVPQYSKQSQEINSTTSGVSLVELEHPVLQLPTGDHGKSFSWCLSSLLKNGETGLLSWGGCRGEWVSLHPGLRIVPGTEY